MMTEDVRQYDRRKHARVVKDLFAVYATADPFKEGLFKTENISGSGILFRSRDPLKIGTVMAVNIHLPDYANPIPVEARVVRTDSSHQTPSTYDIGIAFTRFSDTDKKQLLGNLLTQDDFFLFR